MSFPDLFGRLLGVEGVKSVDRVVPSFAASWAQNGPAWVLFGCLALTTLVVFFYFRFQTVKSRRWRVLLAVVRSVVLSLLLVILADPVLKLVMVNYPRPMLWVLLDGTESMAIADELPNAEQKQFSTAVALDSGVAGGTNKISRADYVRAWLKKKNGNVLAALESKFRIQGFILDRADGVRSLDWNKPGSEVFDPALAGNSLTTAGQMTAIGRAFESLVARRGTSPLAGVVMISDFDQNSGPSPFDAAKGLGAPVYAIGIGPTAAVDLGVDLQIPPVMKKAERATLMVTLRQSGLDNQTVAVLATARRVDGPGGPGDALQVGSSTATLKSGTMSVDIPVTPTESGRFEYTAEVKPLAGETITQNNRSSREVQVQDDFLRLLYVEFEPTWEWRFIKEVFHRDPLVGMNGFRTYLRSSDASVRQGKQLFVPTLTPARSEFFANDVIFLGDMPADMLSARFCELTKEFVGTFGGGLVLIAGQNFGPEQLASTPLADLLPVIPETGAKPIEKGFELRLTGASSGIDFMRLGNDEKENARAWDNLGTLSWYQPVARLHPLATALAEHPTDMCQDHKTPQPLIAIRRYGRGEVVYIGFNETWRLRRKYGELFYRQFWGQMIHRLGLSHALGSQKRFVVRTDRPQYQPDDVVTVTVEAYNANFEALTGKDVEDQRLTGELFLPARTAEGKERQPLMLPMLRNGIFEARIPVFTPGEHRILVKDPISGEMVQASFQVAALSAERRSAVRNVRIQDEIVRRTGGKAYDLVTAAQLSADIRNIPGSEHTVKVISLWDTWLVFLLVAGLLIIEWFVRKMRNLP